MAATVDVSETKTKVEEWHRTEIRFHGFADLPDEPSAEVTSPEFECCGIRWRLVLLPGGESHLMDGYVSIYLETQARGTVDLNFGIAVIGQHGEIVCDSLGDDEINDYKHPAGTLASWNLESAKNPFPYFEVPKFAKRSTVFKSLTDGALVVRLGISPSKTAVEISRPFIPENAFAKNMTKLFMDEETSDVKFEVGMRGGGNKKKRAKKSVDFLAHQLVLKDNAPILADLAKSWGSGGALPVTVPVDDVNADIFRQLLLYVYGGKIETEYMKAKAKEIIDVADRFGVVGLKLEAEACYVKSLELNIENLIDHLLYSDAKNCALLKETAMDFVVAHRVEVLKKVSFDDCPGSLTKDLLAATARAMNEGNEDDEFSTLRVSDLRRRVHERGLDVDGSRETLIGMLRDNS